MKYVWWVFLILVAVIIIAFAVLNAQSVELNYFFAKQSMPLIVLIIAAFILGSLFGIITGYIKGRRLRKKKASKE